MNRQWVLLLLLFLGSGFPALVYQVVWQRSLFTLFGSDSVAVSVIVSAFMLGLGAGSLVGGEISRRPGVPLLRIFAAIELCIGLFALFSLSVFDWASMAGPTSPIGLFGLAFLLVLVPTVMMGMTLPLLTTFLVRRSGLVGRSVGTLYAANTLGSALACFLAAYGLMPYLGKQNSLQVAAGLNAIIAVLVLCLDRQERAATDQGPANPSVLAPPQGGLTVPLGMAAAASCGFLSLGFEVVWFRLFSFATAGRAATFAVLLGYFLIGTAAGSMIAAWIAAPGGRFYHYPRQWLGFLLIVACASAVLVSPALVLIAPYITEILRRDSLIILSQGPLVIVPAALFGMILPLTCELVTSTTRGSVGPTLGRLYAANIVGATLGALTVGLFLLDVVPLRFAPVILLAACVVAAAIVAGTPKGQGKALPSLLMLGCVLISGSALVPNFYERLQPRFWGPDMSGPFTDVVETRSGIVTVDRSGTVYGGGVYDGRLNLDQFNDTNGIVRAFVLGALHPSPRRVLMIGLSSGAWAQVVANNPDLQQLVVVEINPGYLEVIRRSELVASLLRNPKVEIVIADGRQWLKRHPSERFDAIIMNTTFSWRNNASNVLSQEFLRLVSSRLAPGGIAFLNPTGSPEVAATALSVFPYALDIKNNLFLSNAPLVFDRERWLSQLKAYRIDGRSVLEGVDASVLEDHVAALPVKDKGSIVEWAKGKRVITDDNMGMEWPRPWR